nr:anaphase-promoting complex subunit 5 isoform X1 [Tanacetum cinerariifolium]
MLSEVGISNMTGITGASDPHVSSIGTSLSVQQQLFVLLQRSLKRADSLKLKCLVASNHLAIAKFDLTHVQRPLLSFGPKASIQLKTNPSNVYKMKIPILKISEAKFLSVSKSGILPVKLQLLHERALHRGHLKLAQQICDELGVLASSVNGVDMEIKTEASLRRARTLLAANQFIRVGRSNGSSNGEPFLDDLVDIGQDIGEGNKAVVRSRGIHGGRCGSSSSAIREGDLVADELSRSHHNFDVAQT